MDGGERPCQECVHAELVEKLGCHPQEMLTSLFQD